LDCIGLEPNKQHGRGWSEAAVRLRRSFEKDEQRLLGEPRHWEFYEALGPPSGQMAYSMPEVNDSIRRISVLKYRTVLLSL
jgi:hypothetical protein